MKSSYVKTTKDTAPIIKTNASIFRVQKQQRKSMQYGVKLQPE